eukprot:TRINITY_DN2709_c0_g1_i1.p1 TRINITY_DN2709_c0_g1~~TRINITY_DN2709_c0_g1_i1.p1  ORF type:complete len:549 (+),score=130.30 TRINITY_DN2709_c0_g1_i1:333-1979(+)
MGSSGKTRWKISFHRSSTSSPRPPKKPPSEFLCPISNSLMADPVIVSSGHSFDRSSAEACKTLGFSPPLPDGSRPDLSSLIPNLALKSAILHWCDRSASPRPLPLPPPSARELVLALMAAENENSNKAEQRIEEKTEETEKEREKELLLKGVSENPQWKLTYAATEVNPRHKHLYCSTSSEEESVAVTPLPLATKPSCYSSSSSSSSSLVIEESAEEEEEVEVEEIVVKLKSSMISDQEEGVIRLRNISRNLQEKRVRLCNLKLLAAIRPLLASRYAAIQTNAVAVIVNLSLEKPNKVKIVRSGAVPPLIDVLRSGSLEAREHAAGALFSLSLDDENKMAIGVLGALPPLLHMLRSVSEQGRQDAALALYHLTLVQSNRSKLVKLGAVPVLLGLVREGEMAGRVLLILCNLASGVEGRVALLDADAVQVFVEMLKKKDVDNSVRENCIVGLFALSQSIMRFKGAAKAAGAMEILVQLAESGSERARQKVKRMLMLLKEKEGGFAEGYEEGVGEGDDGGRGSPFGAFRQQQRYQLHKVKNVTGAHSTEF